MNFAESIAAPPPTLISTSAPTSPRQVGPADERGQLAVPADLVEHRRRPVIQAREHGGELRPARDRRDRRRSAPARGRGRRGCRPGRPPPPGRRRSAWAGGHARSGSAVGGRRGAHAIAASSPKAGAAAARPPAPARRPRPASRVIASPGSPSASAVPSRCASSSATEALSAAGSIGWAASPIRTTRASTGPAAGAEVWSARKPRLQRHRAGYGLGQPARQVCDEARDRPNRRRGLPLRRGGPERPGQRQNVPEQVAPRADRRLLEHRRGDRLVEADGDLQRVVDDDREPVAQPRGKLVPRTFVEVDIAVDRPEADVACDRRVGDEAAHGRALLRRRRRRRPPAQQIRRRTGVEPGAGVLDPRRACARTEDDRRARARAPRAPSACRRRPRARVAGRRPSDRAPRRGRGAGRRARSGRRRARRAPAPARSGWRRRGRTDGSGCAPTAPGPRAMDRARTRRSRSRGG